MVGLEVLAAHIDLIFRSVAERFTSKRARMMVNNIIFGKISMDVVGTYVITNHTTGNYLSQFSSVQSS